MLALLAAATLGSAHFTATGPRACREKVLQGVLFLHSFAYEDARETFVAAQKAAPCPIAFWGEAMTYDHPLWGEHDAEAGKAALAKIPAEARLSPMERGLIEAARALYEHDRAAWLDSLARLHADLPRDDEVALFHALALYATSNDGKDVKRAMRATAIAMDVFERNPNHPGAAHYLIHACDSPEHAILALKAARRYAQIAPSASHALHMPSHIFVQLGMWPEVEKSNQAAWEAGAHHAGHSEWHSYTWLAAARLQLGKDPIEMLERPRKAGVWWVYAQIAQAWLEETQRWDRTDELLGSVPADQQKLVVRARLDAAAALGDEAAAAAFAAKLPASEKLRSEERRVGKECRSR